MNRVLHSRWCWATVTVTAVVCVVVASLAEPYHRHCLLQELKRAGVDHYTWSKAAPVRQYAEITATSALPVRVVGVLPEASYQSWFVNVETIEFDLTGPQSRLTPLHVKALRTFREVKRLRIAGTLTSDDFAVISTLPVLEQFAVFDSSGRTSGIEAFRPQARLESLELHGVQVKGQALRGLPTCENLRFLDLGGELDSESLQAAAACSRLQGLSVLHRNPTVRIGARELSALVSLNRLEKLELNHLDRNALASLPELHKLQHVRLEGDISLSDVERLGRLQRLAIANIASLRLYNECAVWQGETAPGQDRPFSDGTRTFGLPRSDGGRIAVSVRRNR